MKTKWFLFVLGLLVMAGVSEAASGRGGAKAYKNVGYSVAVSTVANGPAVLYEVILASGASGEWISLFDAANMAGKDAYTTTGLVARFLYPSTTANTVIVLDPPLQFNSKMYAVGSAVTGSATFVYEGGRAPGP